MVRIIYFSTVSFVYYFICYVVVVLPVLGLINGTNIYRFKDLTGGCIGGFTIFTLSMFLLSVSGVPPFLGFFIKAYALYSIRVYINFIVPVIFCFFAAISLGYYLSFFFIVILSLFYSVRVDKVWQGGGYVKEELSVSFRYYWLGLLSLISFPFLGFLVL